MSGATELDVLARLITERPAIDTDLLGSMGVSPARWASLMKWAIEAGRNPWTNDTDVLPDVEVDATLASLAVRLRGDSAGVCELDQLAAHYAADRTAVSEAAFALGLALGARQGARTALVARMRADFDRDIVNELRLLKDAIDDVELLDEMWRTTPTAARRRQRLAGIIAQKCSEVGGRLDALATAVAGTTTSETAA